MALDRRITRLLVLALSVALGVMHALAFAPRDLWWLQLAALAAVFWLAQQPPAATTNEFGRARPTPRARVRRAGAIGFAFGLGWFCYGIAWIYTSLHDYGGLWAWLAALATLALASLLALFPALAFALAAWSAPAASRRRVAAWPTAWAFGEWLRGTVLTGFPWIASGYAHTDGPLAGYAPVIGVYGISAAAALVAWAAANALPVTRAAERSSGRPAVSALRRSIVGTAIGAVVLGGGALLRPIAWTEPDGTPLRVALVQGNIAQDLKFADGALERALQTHWDLMRDEKPVDLIVLPESVLPVPLNLLPPIVVERTRELARARGAALVFGAFIEDPPGAYYNSAIGFDRTPSADGDRFQRYSKQHLVPFGEFIPWGFRWFVDLMQIPIGDQQRGNANQVPLSLAGQRIAVNICYEDLFGAALVRAWDSAASADTADAGRRNEPTLLLNISNLAWFGDSIALPQHLQIARMRSLETGRAMLRATNTGATAIIDARGRITASLAPVTQAVLIGAAQPMRGRTPYVRWRDWPLLAVIGSVLLALLAVRWRGQRG